MKNLARKFTVATAGTVVALLPTLLVTSSVWAFTFKKIADTSTKIPGGTGTFVNFLSASISEGNVVFYGRGSSEQNGLYADFGKGLEIVVDDNTPVPRRSENFRNPDFPSISGRNIVFRGFSPSGFSGIYAKFENELTEIAAEGTPIPGREGQFFGSFGNRPSISGRNVAFSVIPQGVYADRGRGLEVIADTSSLVPGTEKTFFEFISNPSISDGNVIFKASFLDNENSVDGIYADFGRGLELVVDANTPVPEEEEKTFSFPFDSVISGTNVAFRSFIDNGNNDDSNIGIYGDFGQGLELIADENTPIPEGEGTFSILSGPSLDGKNVAFFGIDAFDQGGIYFKSENSQLKKLIGSGDILDGKVIQNLDNSVPLGFDKEQISFLANFTDGSSGVFVADVSQSATKNVPEPTSILSFLALGIWGAGSSIHRQSKQKSEK